METTTQETRKRNGYSNGIVKEIDTKLQHCCENITVLNLSRRSISVVDETIYLPPNLSELCLSHNKLIHVPKLVLEIVHLKVLDISNNNISYFNDVPNFCDTIEHLNIASNNLQQPPLWIWKRKPKKLKKLNISCNPDIIHTLRKEDCEDIFHNQTQLTEIDIHNCALRDHVGLLSTFVTAKVLKIGDAEYNYDASNSLIDLPGKGLSKCCDIETLNVCNTNLYTVNTNIDIYKHLKHIDLSKNYMHSLPDEFCNLTNLEVCILSSNKFLYLPNNIHKLAKLTVLLLNSNELCMLPDAIHKLENLKVLDLYDNYLNEVPYNIEYIENVDYAQNYFDEPEDKDYLLKKEKFRLNKNNRIDGRKLEIIQSESESDSKSEDTFDLHDPSTENESHKSVSDISSASEDWDSDEYWIPQYYNPAPPPVSPWFNFVKKKIEEGNFCPMDAHPISVMERVKYEQVCNPRQDYESDGQFDDYSEDDT